MKKLLIIAGILFIGNYFSCAIASSIDLQNQSELSAMKQKPTSDDDDEGDTTVNQYSIVFGNPLNPTRKY